MHQDMMMAEEAVRPPPRRLVRARDVLNKRCTRILVVLDGVCDEHNIAACLRTVEAMGLQYVWIVPPILEKKTTRRSMACVARGAETWLSIERIESAESCAARLISEGWKVWICADGETALSLNAKAPPLATNDMIAIVVGRETDGVSTPLQSIADKRIFLPLAGFSASLNLSVATALVLQRLLQWYPALRQGPTESERAHIIQSWRPHLGASLIPWLDEHPNFFSETTTPTINTKAYTCNHPSTTSTGDPAARLSNGSWAPKSLLRREEEQKKMQQHRSATAVDDSVSSSSPMARSDTKRMKIN